MQSLLPPTLFLYPKKEPTKVSGTETRNQRDRRASRVVKGMAALDPLYHSIRFMMKNSPNTTLKPKHQNKKQNTLSYKKLAFFYIQFKVLLNYYRAHLLHPYQTVPPT